MLKYIFLKNLLYQQFCKRQTQHHSYSEPEYMNGISPYYYSSTGRIVNVKLLSKPLNVTSLFSLCLLTFHLQLYVRISSYSHWIIFLPYVFKNYFSSIRKQTKTVKSFSQIKINRPGKFLV